MGVRENPVMDTPLLEVSGISKSFGVVRALDNVGFTVNKGEIHTLLGENGAGKSTLLKIIKGEQPPDTGDIKIAGESIGEYTPLRSQELGVSIVHQELAIFENMQVAENIFPASEFLVKGGRVDYPRLYKKAEESLKLFDLDIAPNERMENLSLAEQQVVEILRAISMDQKLVLLDEPTSGLKAKETEKLMEILLKLKNKGITIIYISHRIPELMKISDRITVMRDGQYIETFDNNPELTENDLISAMVGREFSSELYNQKKAESIHITDDVVFEVDDLSQQKSITDINFKLYRGEVLGVFGLEGSGVLPLSRKIFGLEGRDSGRFKVKDREIKNVNPKNLIKNKVLYLNNNRKSAGLLLDMTALDNVSLTVMDKASRFGFVNFGILKEITKKYIDLFSISIPSFGAKPKNLSGGNQQKLMIAMCLAAEPDCLIINEPTRGVDVGAKVEIHKSILGLAEKGVGTMLFTSQLPELISLSDRVIVVKNNKVAATLTGDEISEENIMSYAAGSGGV